MSHGGATSPGERPDILCLQGGGALGAYQAGVYETLYEREMRPDWMAGISIGAINAAIIAGNRPGDCIANLRTFWHKVSSEVIGITPADDGPARRWFNEVSAATIAAFGAPGFFRPRLPDPFAVAMYDTAPLRETLLELVDFDLLNDSPVRFSVGAVNVRTGNLCWFDNRAQTITPEHVMASGALPPGFPAVEIDGEYYWDGGLVSNTPLQHVLDVAPRCDMTIYQVDLFHARGDLPGDLSAVLQREKDIRYSSRTRFNTDAMQELEELRLSTAKLIDALPEELREHEAVQKLAGLEQPGAVCVLHLINRRERYESYSKDYEFSRATVNEHWKTGRENAACSLDHGLWQDRDLHRRGVVTFDLTNPDGARVRDASGTVIEQDEAADCSGA